MTEQHVILCGLGMVGWRVLAALQQAGLPVVVIDNRCSPNDPRLGNARLVIGDCRYADALNAAEVDNARGILILTSSDLISISTALMVRTLNPTVRIVVRMFNQQLVQGLGAAAHNIVALSTSALTAPLLAQIARTGQALGTFQMDSGVRQHVTELKVEETSPLVGKGLGDLAERHEAKVIAYTPALDGKPRFLSEINVDAKLARGDRLVLLCDGAHLDALFAEVNPGSLPDLAWAGMVRRYVRIALRTLAGVDLSVKICAVALLIVIALSTLIFHFGMQTEGPPDSFYRTVSLIATGADMGGARLDQPWQKVFVSVLRILGTALIAAFTAILTNYLVCAQLGGVFEVRRIPDSGHLIVCGLGNVGFRVVEELLAEEEQVVIIESVRDNPFIATARRQGAAVIVGDATLPQVLKQANAAGSRAVIAATSNDLVNLEIALLTREARPAHRVLLRLGDPNLARTLREAANVRLAFSIPELAAPAFVAALFGDRVRGVFFVAGRLLVVVDLVVAPGGPLEGQPVRVAAVDFQLIPLALASADGMERGPSPRRTIANRRPLDVPA